MGDRNRILVVDDSDELRDMFSLALEQAGYFVDTAASGEAGFEKARASRPALLLLDVVMPGMDGLEVLLKLRSDLTPPIPQVILCSGFDMTEDEALRRGAMRFLRKPVDIPDLIDAVADALAGRAVPCAQVELQRRHSARDRSRTRDRAAELMRRIETRMDPSETSLEQMADDQLVTAVEYLGLGAGAIAMVRGERLLVMSATDGAGLSRGLDLGALLPQSREVLETGSALVLPDASRHPYSSVSRAFGGAQFFAGAPLTAADGLAVGVVCLFDRAPRPFNAEDFSLLQILGRRFSDLLSMLADGQPAAYRPGRYGRRIAIRSTFERALDAELSVLDRRGGSMELAVADVEPLDCLRHALDGAPSHERLLAGVLTAPRVAIFKRALDQSARATLGAVLDSLRAEGELHAAGIVDLGRWGARGLSAADLMRVAERTFDRAVEQRDPIRRLVIEEHTE